MIKNRLTIVAAVASILSVTAFGLALLFNNNVSAIVQPQPTLLSVTPASSDEVGGYQALIQGTALGGVSAVTFGGVSAEIISATEESVTVTVPAHSVGTVDISVTSYEMSATLPGAFTYTGVTPPPEPEDPCIQDKKTAVCHYPEGNPENPQLLCLPPTAVKAHLKQHPEDHQGVCESM